MASNTCPLCGGKLKNNYCGSCGYNVPESTELSALYNYDPSDYPQTQEEKAPIREMYPDKVQMEEIYPNRPEPLKFKVRNDEGKTVNGAYNNPQTPYANNQPPSPYANNRQQNPYANNRQNPYAMPYLNQQQNPYANNNPYGGAQQNNAPPNRNNPYANLNSPYANKNQQQITNFSELFKKYWWLFLVIFVSPLAGVIVLSIRKRSIDKKYIWVFVLSIILRFVIFPL